MSIFSGQRSSPPPIPVVDVGMQATMAAEANAAANQVPYLDPMAAAQLSRSWEQDASAVGVAHITVDNRRIIDEFKSRLRGYIIQRQFDSDTGEELAPKMIKNGSPVMNEEGVNHLCGILEASLSKSIMLSNIPTKDAKWIPKVCSVFWRTAALQIAINSEEWNVDRSRRDYIPMELSILLHSNFMRSFEDGERKKLYPGQKHVTTTMINPASMQPERRSFINF